MKRNTIANVQTTFSAKNQSGFSIAEVIVALSIMGVLSLGLATMIQNHSRAVFMLEDQLSHQSLKLELERLFKNNELCTSSLKDIKIPTSILTPEKEEGSNFVIKNSDGKTLYKADTLFDRLKIASINVQNVDITDPSVGSGVVNLSVGTQRLRGGSFAFKNINIRQVVNIDPVTMQAIECTGIDDESGLGSGCYRQASTALVGSGGFSVIPGSVPAATIPKGVKMVSVTLPPLSASGGSEGTPCYVDENTFYFEIGGSSPYKPGQVIRVSSANSNRGSGNDSGLYVGSQRVATYGFASNHDCYPRIFFSADQVRNPSLCIKRTDNPANHNVIFWK